MVDIMYIHMNYEKIENDTKELMDADDTSDLTGVSNAQGSGTN